MTKKQPYFKDLSTDAIGFLPQSTKKIDKNGIIEQCKIISFKANFKGIHSTIDIEVQKEYFDNKGNKLETVVSSKIISVKDMPEMGLIEYDEAGLPIMETYEKTSDENLEATRWGQLLGGHVYPGLVYKVNEHEGYPQDNE